MKMAVICLAQILVLSSALVAGPSTSLAEVQPEIGKWWKDSDVVQKLQLSEAQVQRIEQAFLHFRPVLANLNSELASREAELNSLMNANSIDEARILSQTELVAVSRASLEKANSSMMLSIRKELSREQWEQLQKIRELRRASVALSAGKPVSQPSRPPKPGPRDSSASTQPAEQVYRVGGPVQAPRVRYQPLPTYTQEAREAKVEGIVLLQGIVRKNGRITDLKVLQGIGYGLDQSAINTITTEWRFEPGTKDGQPVDVQVNMEVSFRRY
jgi:TonB family protein